MSDAVEFSPHQYVESLTDAEKESVFYTILEEALADGDEPFATSLGREGGPILAYLLSAKEYNALQKQYRFPHADADDYEAQRIPRSERNWDTVEEVMDWIDEGAEQPVCESKRASASSEAA